MSQRTLRHGCVIAMLIYFAVAVLLYWIGDEQFWYRDSKTDMLTPSGGIGEITSDMVIEQAISVDGDALLSVDFVVHTYERQNTGILRVEVYELSGQLLSTQDVDVSQLPENGEFTVIFPEPIFTNSKRVLLRITAPDAVIGNAITLYYGTTMKTARNEVEVPLSQEDCVMINGQRQSYALSISISSRERLCFGSMYGYYVLGGSVLLAATCLHLTWCNRKGRATLLLKLLSAAKRYRYLMKQLVARDFKTKYKRSVLGVLWSFLNPLLTMLVQYIVFSTIFKSDIQNFAVYLLIGIICFSFFNEATSMALTSVVGNASLITKVYVPKYIYPLTRVMSSTINFGLSLVPLLLVLFFTKTPIRPSLLLLPYGVGCLFALSLGVGMILASMMVFFRDTQFLWGVLSMLWMYATPIFYPESIIPSQFMLLYKMNPLYQIIRFIRILLMEGVSPEPKAYLLMLIAAAIPLIVGAFVFKKTQDRFVLNL